MSDDPDRTSTDRREFLKLLGVAGVSAAVGSPVAALAQTSKAEGEKSQEPKTPPPAAEAPEISPDARSMLEIVKRRYGQHLSEAQLEEILQELNFRVGAGEALRKFPLANGDEPDFIFSA